MNGLITIAKRELYSYFVTPVAYIFLALFTFLMGIMFNLFLVSYIKYMAMYQMGMQEGMSLNRLSEGLYSNMNILLLIVLPALTMKLFSEEKAKKTLVLLRTSPVSVTEIVLGKFFAAVIIFLVFLLCSVVYPGVLALFGNPDMGIIYGSYIGIFFVGCSYLAVGLFASSLTESQLVALIITFVINFGMWLTQAAARYAPGVLQQILESMSLLSHYNNLAKGTIELADVVFYVTFIGFMLFLTHRVIDSENWR